MRKSLLFLASLLMAGSLMAQTEPTIVSTTPSNRNAVLEEYTGVNCQYCPDGHKIANALKAANPGRVSLINVHAGTYAVRYKTNYGTALLGNTDVSGYPAGTVNRTTFGSTMALQRNQWTAAAAQVMAKPSCVNVAAKASIDCETGHMTVLVEAFYTAASSKSTNSLNVVLLQDNVMGSQTGAETWYPEMIEDGLYRHNHMLRDMLTGTWGETLTTTDSGTFVSRTYEYDIPRKIGDVTIGGKYSDLHVVVFIAEDRKNIITGADAEMTFSTPLITAFKATQADCGRTYAIKATVLNNRDENMSSITLEHNGRQATYPCNIAPGNEGVIDLGNGIANPMPAVNSSTSDMSVDTVRILSYRLAGASQDEAMNGTMYDVEYGGMKVFGMQNPAYLSVRFDAKASESSYEIIDMSTCETIYSYQGTEADNSSEHLLTISPLHEGNYKIVVRDAAGNGMNKTSLGYRLQTAEGTVRTKVLGNFGQSGEMYVYLHGAGDGTMGLDEAQAGFSLYPNPAGDRLHVESAAAVKSLTVVDMSGRELLTAPAGTADLNTASLPAGVYMLRVATEAGVSTQKFVKE